MVETTLSSQLPVTETNSPGLAQPQTGTSDFCCMTIPSEKMEGRVICPWVRVEKIHNKTTRNKINFLNLELISIAKNLY